MSKAKHPTPKNFKAMLDKAWPMDRLTKLGENQRNLLSGMMKSADHVLTEPSLNQMLVDVEQDFQEELIPFLKHLQPLVKLGSKRHE